MSSKSEFALWVTLFTVGTGGLLSACSAKSSPSIQADDPAARDAGVVDAEGDAGSDGDDAADADDGGCHPRSVAGFEPPAFVPSHRSLVCNGFNADGGLVQSYGDSCIGGASSYDKCKAFLVPPDPAAQACFRCLVSTESPDASEYGAVVVITVPMVNYPGCVAALDPSDAGESCAQTITSAATCAEFACKAACPITDQASEDAYNQCWSQAVAAECVGYWQSAESCIAQEQGDGGTEVNLVCFDGIRPTEQDFLSLAHYLCGAD